MPGHIVFVARPAACGANLKRTSSAYNVTAYAVLHSVINDRTDTDTPQDCYTKKGDGNRAMRQAVTFDRTNSCLGNTSNDVIERR